METTQAMLERASRPVQNAISTPLGRPSLSSVVTLLTALAESRQATVSPQTLKLYAHRLSCFPLCDIRLALSRIADRPRQDGQTAFPDRGTLVREVQQVQLNRKCAEARKLAEEREVMEFDTFLAFRMERGEQEAEIALRFPVHYALWRRYKAKRLIA